MKRGQEGLLAGRGSVRGRELRPGMGSGLSPGPGEEAVVPGMLGAAGKDGGSAGGAGLEGFSRGGGEQRSAEGVRGTAQRGAGLPGPLPLPAGLRGRAEALGLLRGGRRRAGPRTGSSRCAGRPAAPPGREGAGPGRCVHGAAPGHGNRSPAGRRMLRRAGGADRAELLPPGAGGHGVDVFARADPGVPVRAA